MQSKNFSGALIGIIGEVIPPLIKKLRNSVELGVRGI
jgi:hypothetical protein